MLRRFLSCIALSLLMISGACAEDIKIAIGLGFTGPIESLTPGMAKSAELAVDEVSKSGRFLNGSTVEAIRVDTTCTGMEQAISAARHAIEREKVRGFVGAACSGATMSILNNVAIPAGMLLVSPSASSPALSTADTNGFFVRTAPSDARQGKVMAEMMREQGLSSAVIVHVDNDYGKLFAENLKAAFEDEGGRVIKIAAYEYDPSGEKAIPGGLESSDGEAAVIIGYGDANADRVFKAVSRGQFSAIVLNEDTLHSKTVRQASVRQRIIGSIDLIDPQVLTRFIEIPGEDHRVGKQPVVFGQQSYDAAALILLAMQAAGSSDPSQYKQYISQVANAPGEKIYAGELSRALELLSQGHDIDYVGASNVELINDRDVAGNFRKMEVVKGELVPLVSQTRVAAVEKKQEPPAVVAAPTKQPPVPVLRPDGAKVALVLGNGAYEHTTPLKNPRNDARAMAAMLKGMGFTVIDDVDLNKRGMESKVLEFVRASKTADLSLFFYAGHGIQVGGQNYLVPIDAKVEDDTALDFELVNVAKVSRYMGGNGKVGIVLLDACRDNPLSRSLSRSLGTRSSSVSRGLAPITSAGGGLLVGFATAPGDVAADGENMTNSPFTTALLKHLPAPGREIQSIMTRVKREVITLTDNRQRPWHNSDLAQDVVLLPAQ